MDLKGIEGFDWDEGNSRKSVERHGVSQAEAEQVFRDPRLLVSSDDKHSVWEPRFHALGTTEAGRSRQVTFTLRASGTKIRVISARDMNRKERDPMKKTKKLKPIPRFRSEAEERAFWESHDTTDYVDWSEARRVRFPNLKPSTTSISLRLPVDLLEQIKVAANRRDVPYQSLIKMWLFERVSSRP
jgi:uncharacterized DUF497 family protein